MTDVTWHRSGRCDSGSCVEAARVGADFAIRDSDAPAEVLRFTDDEWTAFTDAIRRGEFDLR